MLTRNEYDILFVTLAWLGGFLPLFVWHARSAMGKPPTWAPPTWLQCVGLALVLVPFIRMGINVVLTFDRLLVYTVLQPVQAEVLWSRVGRSLRYNLLFPLVGLLLWHNVLPRWMNRRAPTARFADMLRAHNLAPRTSWGRDAMHGLALFAFIALAYVGALLLSRTALASLAANGDESQYWIHLTIPLILMLSGMAGVTEELLFRGILLAWLSRRMPFVWAALLQATFFALIHAGYGTWLHVAGPFVFGLGMAWIVRVLGLLPAMLLHAQVNVVFFALEVFHVVEGVWLLLVVFGALNVAAALLTRVESVRLLWASLVTGLARLRGRKEEANA